MIVISPSLLLRTSKFKIGFQVYFGQVQLFFLCLDVSMESKILLVIFNNEALSLH